MDPTKRFLGRAERYAKYRPSYPTRVLDLLVKETGLKSGARIADLGSGTGIFTRLLLERGCQVWAVEPNAEMRAVSERDHGQDPNFHSIDAPVESTGLAANSVDLIASAQAFHWFDPIRAKQEFQRILVPGGWVALIWNDRPQAACPLLDEYDELLLRYGTDYAEVRHTWARMMKRLEGFFAPGFPRRAVFPNPERMDLEKLRGRLLSNSYVPRDGDPGFAEIIEALEALFYRHAKDGFVTMEYETSVTYGKL